MAKVVFLRLLLEGAAVLLEGEAVNRDNYSQDHG